MWQGNVSFVLMLVIISWAAIANTTSNWQIKNYKNWPLWSWIWAYYFSRIGSFKDIACLETGIKESHKCQKKKHWSIYSQYVDINCPKRVSNTSPSGKLYNGHLYTYTWTYIYIGILYYKTHNIKLLFANVNSLMIMMVP